MNNAEVVKEKKSINLWSIISIFELLPEIITHFKKKETKTGLLIGTILVILSLFI